MSRHFSPLLTVMSLLSFLAMADVLLLDAPTANLDIGHALNVVDLCQYRPRKAIRLDSPCMTSTPQLAMRYMR